MMNKLKKEYFASLLSVIVVGAVLVVALYTFYDSSLAWFSNNKEVMAQGMSVVSRGAPKLEKTLMVDGVAVNEETTLHTFEDFKPTDTVTFDIVVKNVSGEKIDLSLLLGAPKSLNNGAYVEGGKYHYFGTQIRIKSVKATQVIGENAVTVDNMALSGIDQYLMTLDEKLYIGDGTLPPTGIPTQYDFTKAAEKVVTEDIITLEDNAQVTLTIVLEFVDNGEVQNAYIGFNASGSGAPAERYPLSCQFICFAEFTDQ